MSSSSIDTRLSVPQVTKLGAVRAESKQDSTRAAQNYLEASIAYKCDAIEIRCLGVTSLVGFLISADCATWDWTQYPSQRSKHYS